MCGVGHGNLQKLKYIFILLTLSFCCWFTIITNSNTFPDGQMVLGGVGGSPCLSVMSIHSMNGGPLSSF